MKTDDRFNVTPVSNRWNVAPVSNRWNVAPVSNRWNDASGALLSGGWYPDV